MKTFLIVYIIVFQLLLVGCIAQLHYNSYYGELIYYTLLLLTNPIQDYFKNIIWKAFNIKS